MQQITNKTKKLIEYLQMGIDITDNSII